ncbi:hypothetical protein ABC345_17480 [Shouchella sp. 1P09AA]|uniref:hypothetical protein n=1 Tax=unclassified Shouchella TaxID=2893065 RepID=UPI0039A17D61
MEARTYSWRSYGLIGLSILVTLTMILLDPIASATSEAASFPMMLFIFIGTVVTVIGILLVLISKNEPSKLAIVALIITLINCGVIGFFFFIGLMHT